MRITNIVTRGCVNTPLDLCQLAREFPDVTYRPEKFSAAVWRHKDITGTLMIFSTGSLLHLGKPDGEPSETHMKKYLDILLQYGYEDLKLHNVKCATMSATHTLSGKMKLDTIPGADYDPEFFNGAILRRGSMVFCIFHTGSVSITGIKNVDDVYPILLELELFTYM